MADLVEQVSGQHKVATSWYWLWGLLGVQAAIYAIISFLSGQFAYNAPLAERPLLMVLGLLTVNFALHLVSLKLACQLGSRVRLEQMVLVGAVLLRVIVLPSEPIQELDIYRYLWDGAVVADRGNPYRYSPRQIKSAEPQMSIPADLRQSLSLRNRSESLAEVLRRIHFAEFTTVYPPVAQAVYAAAAASTPHGATVYQRVLIMKCVLILFDLATVLLMFGLLRMTGRSAGWSIVYAWSPLVLKEFANSGHFDTIAVCLTTGALYCLVRGLISKVVDLAKDPRNAGSLARSTTARSTTANTKAQLRHRANQLLRWPLLAGVLLGLGIGAKLYPVVLLPLLVALLVRRASWKHAVACGCTCAMIGSVSLAPMLMTQPQETTWLERAPVEKQTDLAADRPGSGLTVFLTRWEMNDLPFMLLYENLRPAANAPHQLWFVVMPDSWRASASTQLASLFGTTPGAAAFRGTRAITAMIFLAIALSIAWRASGSKRPDDWLRGGLLTIAWFWALSPTMNPWYWTWAMPLLPMARRRAWLAVSGLVMMYYLRFWVLYHYSETALWGTPYVGEEFFHFVIVPVEHGLWLGWLAWEWVRERARCGSGSC